MDHIKASEDSFGRANNYFILMWVLTSLIIVTAFVDFRSHRLEKETNDNVIDFYESMEMDVGQLALQLRSFVYLEPGYETEESAIETMRRQRSALIAQLRATSSQMLRARYLSTDQRVAINDPLNKIGALLLLNDGTMQTQEFPYLDGFEQLLFADHAPGSYLIAENIPSLRVEDAVRYHWLSTLGMRMWLDEIAKLQRVLNAEGDPAQNVIRLEALHDDRVLGQESRKLRAFSEKVWRAWITAPQDAITEAEKRRRKNLTLVQTSQFLNQAREKDAELALRATGQTSTVKVPVIAIPLQLRDAVLVAPLILIFCALAIAIYTLRALRYAPPIKPQNTVVGNLPGYYAFYGFWPPLGIPVAIFLLMAPLMILMFVLPLLVPVLVDGLDWKAIIYFGGGIIAFLFLAVPVSLIPKVIKLMSDGALIMALPEPGFPDLGIRTGRLRSTRFATASIPAIVPASFIGCWKLVSSEASLYYLQLEADGRYLISDGKKPFQISADGQGFDWDGEVWLRQNGTGQTILGTWEQPGDQLTIHPDGTSSMHIPNFTIPGKMNTFGDLSGGTLCYFEQRATIVSVMDWGNGTYDVTAQALFGGVSTFQLSLEKGLMVLKTETGETIKFSSVNCLTLQ